MQIDFNLLQLLKPAPVSLDLYDLSGRRLAFPGFAAYATASRRPARNRLRPPGSVRNRVRISRAAWRRYGRGTNSRATASSFWTRTTSRSTSGSRTPPLHDVAVGRFRSRFLRSKERTPTETRNSCSAISHKGIRNRFMATQPDQRVSLRQILAMFRDSTGGLPTHIAHHRRAAEPGGYPQRRHPPAPILPCQTSRSTSCRPRQPPWTPCLAPFILGAPSGIIL